MAVAGFSVGEITALIFSGAISFSEVVSDDSVRSSFLLVFNFVHSNFVFPM